MGGINLKQPVSDAAMDRLPWVVRGFWDPHCQFGSNANLFDHAAASVSSLARISNRSARLLVHRNVWRRACAVTEAVLVDQLPHQTSSLLDRVRYARRYG